PPPSPSLFPYTTLFRSESSPENRCRQPHRAPKCPGWVFAVAFPTLLSSNHVHLSSKLLQPQVTQKIWVLHQFFFSIREYFFPYFEIPDAKLLQSRNQHDIALQLGVFPQERRNQNAALLIYHPFIRAAEIVVLEHQHFAINLWLSSNFFFQP